MRSGKILFTIIRAILLVRDVARQRRGTIVPFDLMISMESSHSSCELHGSSLRTQS